MPLKYFVEQFNEIPSDKIIAGNFGVIGITGKKLQQVGVESRHEGRQSKDLLKIICETRMVVLFKQIVVSPFYYIIYWNEIGLRLYNDRAKDSVL